MVAFRRTLLVLLLSSAVAGAAASPESERQPLSRASALIGDPVEDARGWRIGVLDDLLFDPSDGRLVLAVVHAGSRFMAPSGPLALTLPDAKVGVADGNLRTELELKDIKRLSPLASAMEDLEPAMRARLVSVKDLMDASLRATGGANIGGIDDAVVDIGAAKLKFLIADYDPSWSSSGKDVAIDNPRVKPDAGGELTVTVDASRLDSVAQFDAAGAGLPRDSWWRKAQDFAGLR